MKRIVFLAIVFLFAIFSTGLKANPVDFRTARQVGTMFVRANAKMPLRNSDDLQLVTTYNINRGDAAFYVFNTPNGFVIIAADDCSTPVLGYSDEGQFDLNNIPIQMEEYLQGFVEQIQYGKEHQIQADENTTMQWELVMATGHLDNNRSTNSVDPLLSELWNQGCYYNALCPSDALGPCGHTYVGCAAAAMGQIMHFWRYPSTGSGTHSYSPSGYSQQTVNFWQTTYDWEHMPNELTSMSSDIEINAVATLLWHCGVSIDMMYGYNGSGAYPSLVPAAFIDYFNYSSDLYSQIKGDNASWLAQVKANLDLGRPLHYSGWNSNGNGGHSFVCDGYNSSNQLHFNWGWSGLGNGFFAINALAVAGYNFSYNNFAVFNIHPNEELDTFTITTESNPSIGGTMTGGGTYHYGATATLTAFPNENYLFVNWTKDGLQVSAEPTCHVTVREDATYVANFRRTNIYNVVIGEGGATTSQHLPLTASSSYSLSQQIYLAEEINTNGPITDVSFYYTGTMEATFNIDLHLKHTQKTSFSTENDWGVLSPGELCYSGLYCVDGTPGWKRITLDTPFNYNGSDNLLVSIDNNSGTIFSDFDWASFESNSTTSLLAYCDSLNYNPYCPIGGHMENYRNKLSLTFQVTQGTDFVVNPDPINLGFRPSGCWMQPITIDVFNSGAATYINGISSSNSFFELDLLELSQ